MVAVGEWLVFPEVLVSSGVVVAAEGDEVADAGGSAFGVGDAVVEVALGGGHAAPGEYAGGVEGFDDTFLADEGSAYRGADVGGQSGLGVVEGDSPF